MLFIENLVTLKKPKKLYEKEYKEHYVVFNPLVPGDSIVLLDYDQYEILNSIDNKKTAGQVYRLFSKKHGKKFVSDTINYLIKSKIIYLLNFNEIFYPAKMPKTVEKTGIYLSLTNQCNLGCTYCFQERSSESLSKEDGEKYIQKILNIYKKRKTKELNINFFGGEPLLNFSVLEHLTLFTENLCKKLKIKPKFSIITNGTLVSKEIALKLKELKFNVAVSIGGVGNIHDKNRPYRNGRESFCDILNGLENLVLADVNFGANVVLSSDNYESMPELTEFLAKYNASINFMFLRETSDDEFNKINLDKMALSLKKCVQFARENLKEKPYLRNSSFIDSISLKNKSIYSCGIGFSTGANIGVDGKMFSCDLFGGDSIGNIMDIDAEKELFSPKDTNNFNPPASEKEVCNECQWIYVCRGGSCPGITYNIAGDAKKPFPYCEVVKATIPELIELEAERLLIMKEEFFKTL